MLHKLIIISVLSFLLAACGGGGGGDSATGEGSASTPVTPTIPSDDEGDDDNGAEDGGDEDGADDAEPATLSLTVSSQTVAIAELNSHTISLQANYTGDRELSFSANASTSVIMATVDENSLVLSIDDISSYNEQGTVTVTVSDGEVQDSQVITVAMQNTSLLEDISDIESFIVSLSTYYAADISVQNVLTYYYEIAALLGEVTPTEASSELMLLSTELTDLQFDNADALFEISVELSDAVTNQTVTELDVTTWFSEVYDINSAYAQSASDAIEQARGATSNTVPSIPLDTVYTTGEVSLFIGNPDLGEYSEGSFFFAPTYNYLQELTESSSAVCATLIDGEV
jgi:hypothetical protein